MRTGSRAGRILLLQRALSVIAVVLVAVLTLIPRRTERQFTILAEGRMLGHELSDALVFVVIGMAGLAVIGLVWKSRLAARLRMSWPFFVVGVLYLLGLTALASSAVRGIVFGLVSTGMGSWLHRVSAELDAEHAIAYAGLAIIFALAWREKAGVPWLALGLFAFGAALELLQAFAPQREPRLGDLASNGLGIMVGLAGVFLFDLVADARNRDAVRVDGAVRTYGQRRRRRSSRSARPSSGVRRAGLVTALAGLLIVLASVLAGSMAELRLAQVGWRLLAPFSAAYALTFWLGVAVVVAGLVMLRGLGGRHRERTRRVRLP